MAGNRMTKTEFVSTVAERTGLTRKQVTSVLDAVNGLVTEQLGSRGPGEVVIPGLVKINMAVKAASPAHEGINPFTKLPQMFKAKPERRVVKVRPIKALRDAA